MPNAYGRIGVAAALALQGNVAQEGCCGPDQGHQDLDAACPRGPRPFHGAPVLLGRPGLLSSGSSLAPSPAFTPGPSRLVRTNDAPIFPPRGALLSRLDDFQHPKVKCRKLD
jgi:hypothetical protein